MAMLLELLLVENMILVSRAKVAIYICMLISDSASKICTLGKIYFFIVSSHAQSASGINYRHILTPHLHSLELCCISFISLLPFALAVIVNNFVNVAL